LSAETAPSRNLVMADKEKFQTSKSGTGQKPREHDVKRRGIVGNYVPDESKERHTEIAVEAGNRAGDRQKTDNE
jgi:hypothetical protein